jgi:type VII secretion integral membrane protein EccD
VTWQVLAGSRVFNPGRKDLDTTVDERTQLRTSPPGRLRFVLGSRATDVALPADVPLVDLLPAVLPHLGAEFVEQGADHEGWVAQRLGQSPLDEERTPAELELRDGETLYLRPRVDAVAPIDYDDLVDGVAERIREDPGAWSRNRTRWMLLLGAGFMLLLGLVVLAGDGPEIVRSSLIGGTALALLIGAAAVTRGFGDSGAGVVLVAVSVCYAATGGWLVAGIVDPVATPAIRLAVGAAAALVGLCIGMAAVAEAGVLFIAALTLALLVTVPTLISVLGPASPARAAAIGLTLSLIVGMFVPGIAFRLAGLSLPMLPTNADELREDTDPVPHQLVVERGTATLGYLKALHVGVGLAQVLMLVVLGTDGSGWSLILTGVLALLLLMRSRHLDGAVQRWSLLVPAGIAVLVAVLTMAGQQEFVLRLARVWFPVLGAGLLLLLLAGRLPGRRLRPYWGRAVDILESLTAVAVLPVLLAVLDVYGYIRGLSG